MLAKRSGLGSSSAVLQGQMMNLDHYVICPCNTADDESRPLRLANISGAQIMNDTDTTTGRTV
eukprot:477787-Prorocentrum_minimum.AAC.1